MSKSRAFSISALLLLCLAGCASKSGAWQGPTEPAPVTEEPWGFQNQPGKLLRTPHYALHSTLEDEVLLAGLAQLMEGALTQYQRLAPEVPLSDRPMDCYFFARRGQWVEFTQGSTGPDAAIYLKIVRGAYTVGDRFVAYFLGDHGTYAIASHEGWHQYAARHFKGRLPPFLEEGLACLFENVQWQDQRPRWNLSRNYLRVQALRRAIEAEALMPLEELIQLHAGMVVSQGPTKVEAFYAQSWAFARFLRDADSGHYRPALHRLLSDVAAGTVHDPTGIHQRAGRPWHAGGVPAMLQHYLAMDMKQIDAAYQAFMRQIAQQETEGTHVP